MEEVEGVADLQVEQTAGIPQLVVELKRAELARFGIPVGDVADLVETALNGMEVTDVFEEDRITSILLRLDEEYRRSEERVASLLIDAPSGERIPLSQLADIRHGEGVAVGLVYAAEVARLLDRIDQGAVDEHRRVVEGYELSSVVPAGTDIELMLELFARDKKATAGITFVLDGESGVEPVSVDDLDLLREAFHAVS